MNRETKLDSQEREMRIMKSNISLDIKMNTEDLDSAIEKASRLKNLLLEVQDLICSLNKCM